MVREDNVFLCGYTPRRSLTLADLQPEERKAVQNFSKFLSGKGKRCPDCLHKAKKHELKCNAKGCNCTLTNSDVYAVRKEIGAR
jgi:hypothetical protein